MSLKGKAYIVGAYEHPTRKAPDKSLAQLHAEVAKYDHTLIRGFDVRFSAPVYPGETILTDMWVDKNIVSFRCRLKEREVTVINNGKCTLAA